MTPRLYCPTCGETMDIYVATADDLPPYTLDTRGPVPVANLRDGGRVPLGVPLCHGCDGQFAPRPSVIDTMFHAALNRAARADRRAA